MGYFRSCLKHHGIILALVLFFLVGCAAHNAENTPNTRITGKTAPADTVEASESGSALKRTVTGIRTEMGAEGPTVWIMGSKALEYTSIKQALPFAVAVYLPDTVIAKDISPVPADDKIFSGVHVGYADKEETTVKVSILLNEDVPYTITEEANALGVVFRAAGGKVSAMPEGAPPAEMAGSEPRTGAGLSNGPHQPKRMNDASVGSGPAKVAGIEFDTQPTGQADIRVTTDVPVRYEARQAGPGQIDLVLFDTRVPKTHQHPLFSKFPNSAVSKVLPNPGPGKKQDSVVEIRIREQVPYQVVQAGTEIRMVFEPSPASSPEIPNAEAGSSTVAAASVQPKKAPDPGEDKKPGPAGARAKQQARQTFLDESPAYTGEKIKLDFYETDIKNVFRILRSVSGLNFAVDDDVQGKVTLSLEEPVPWDQVMDLVLKMNGLGKKLEGNVVRITTLATIAKEEKALQDAITAQKRTIEQKASLAPLVTEYIPINYSSADADIRPHVEKILTAERGRISVDNRTNMVIITDTQDKIDQARDLIFRLDTVTPQIMIEARVVEVTKEFSRSLGLNWNLSNAAETTAGFVNDFNVAVNRSANNKGIKADYSFFRLFGASSTALNAQLEASEEMGDVRIVSSPRILTLDNKQAKIKQGVEYAYLERDDSGGSSVQFKDIDLLLEVTPHVTPDKRISMTVHLTKNDVSSVTASGIPTLATNEAQTELLVNNNETVVIGGVVKSTKSDNNNGVPFLAGIPILGALFGTTQKSDDRNELLIFLTPSIVQLEQRRNISSRAAGSPAVNMPAAN